MYINEPPKDKIIDMVLGVGTYAFGVAYGVWTLLLPVEEIGDSLVSYIFRFTASLSALGAIACLVGVVVRKVTLEGIFIWVALSGLVIYTGIVWGAYFSSNSAVRGSQAFSLMILLFSLAWRGFRLHRSKRDLSKLREMELDATNRLKGEL